MVILLVWLLIVGWDILLLAPRTHHPLNDSLGGSSTPHGKKITIWLSRRLGFLDHVSCSTAQFYPTSKPSGSPWHTTGPDCSVVSSLAAFNVILLIFVLEIPFNFQFDMQCAGNDNSNVSFQVNASFEQILFRWHTWARSKGLRTLGSEWPDKRDKTGLTPWPGVGGIFCVVNRPKITVLALGWFE